MLRIYKVSLLGLILGVFVFTGAVFAEVFPERIQVKGNLLVNESGETKIFKGYQIEESVWRFSTPSTHTIDFHKAIAETKKWGADIIRLSVFPSTLSAFGVDKMLDEVETWVNTAEKNNLYSIIDLHAIGYLPTYPAGQGNNTNGMLEWEKIFVTNPAQYREFWDKASKRFKGNKAVAMYELFNEPLSADPWRGIEDWNDWMDYATNTIDMIRQNDPDTVILVGATSGCNRIYGPDYQGSKGFIERPNVAYAIHVYPSSTLVSYPRYTDESKNWESDWGRYADEVPIVISEVGYCSFVHPDNPFTEIALEKTHLGPGRYRDDIMSYIKSKGLSWIAFALDDYPWHEAYWDTTNKVEVPGHVADFSLIADLNFTPSDMGYFFISHSGGTPGGGNDDNDSPDSEGDNTGASNSSGGGCNSSYSIVGLLIVGFVMQRYLRKR